MGRKRSKGKTKNDPKKVSPADRVQFYHKEPFTVSAGNLFCLACREELSTKKSILGEEVARLLVEVLSTKLGVLTNNVIAAMRDRASVNSVAMRTDNRVFDVGCFSHTLDHVGERMRTPLVDDLNWIGMFSRSPKTRLAWKRRTGLPSPSHSTTRWWSRFEVLDQAFKAFGDVCTFIKDEPDLPPATSTK